MTDGSEINRYSLSILYNPFMPNGISHYHQLDQSISVLRVVRWIIFHFIQILIEQSVSKQWRPDQTPRSAASGLVCTVCLHPTIRTQGLCGLKKLVKNVVQLLKPYNLIFYFTLTD